MSHWLLIVCVYYMDDSISLTFWQRDIYSTKYFSNILK